MRLNTAVVVGASSGIGRQLAVLLAEEGYRVGIMGRRRNLLEELKIQQPDKYIVCECDITDTDDVVTKLNQLAQELEKIDLLILSSGGGEVNEGLEFDIEKQMLDLNVIGFTRVATWTMNYFLQQKYGHLAAITSIAGLRGNRQAPAYGATKAFQINYLQGLQQKAARSGLPIYVTDIRPGFVNTKMAKGNKRFWVAPVEKAGLQIMRAIKRKRQLIYITKRWLLIAFLMRLVPRWIYNRL